MVIIEILYNLNKNKKFCLVLIIIIKISNNIMQIITLQMKIYKKNLIKIKNN